MKTFTCEVCAKEFSRHKPSKYCSRACFFLARRTGETLECECCGKPVYREKNQLARGNDRTFCSPECYNKSQSTKVKVECKTCGAPFLVSPSAVGRGRKYCSQACRDACPDFKRNCWIENNIRLQKGNPTRLELAGRAILEASGLQFTEQVLIAGKFTVDVVIDGLPLVVQWDGDYWHGYRAANDNRPLSDRQARRVALDRSQDAYMAKAGYTVLRFWEHEVTKSPDKVRARILSECRIQQQNF